MITPRLLRWLRAPRRHLDRPGGPPNPFEALSLAAGVVQGISIVFGYSRPPAIETLLPASLRYVWGVLLLIGGLASVVGLYWPWDPVDGVLIKRVGLIGVAGGTLAYGVALFSLGPSGFVAGVALFAFALACIIRAWQVTLALATFREEIRSIGRMHRRGREQAEP